MGLKTINAKQAELHKKSQALAVFAEVAQDLNNQLSKIDAAFKEIDKVRAEIAGKLKHLDTQGVKEFDDYKKSLEWIAVGSSSSVADVANRMTRPLPLAPLQKAVQQQQKEHGAMLDAWIEKHKASFPKELKPGMTFKYKDGSIIEILSPGSQHGAYKVKRWKDGKESNHEVGSISPTWGYKYIQT